MPDVLENLRMMRNAFRMDPRNEQTIDSAIAELEQQAKHIKWLEEALRKTELKILALHRKYQ